METVTHEKLLTAAEVGNRLRLCSRQILNLAKAGKIPAIKIGSRYRFDRAVIDRWLADQSKTFGPTTDAQ